MNLREILRRDGIQFVFAGISLIGLGGVLSFLLTMSGFLLILGLGGLGMFYLGTMKGAFIKKPNVEEWK